MVIEDRFATLRLHGMRRTWSALVETRQHLDLTLSDGIELLLQAEDDDRDLRRSERLLKQASFRYSASLAELSYGAQRGVDKSLISHLATGESINAGTSILITGATGCGKSFLACALGHSACDHGYRVVYANMQKLVARAKIARLEGQSTKFSDTIRRKQLLIIDDFGLVPLDAQQRMDLMEIIEDRHGLLRDHRRKHHRRCHSRPSGSHLTPHRTQGRLHAQETVILSYIHMPETNDLT
jgi:DNA replication protein DnaC